MHKTNSLSRFFLLGTLAVTLASFFLTGCSGGVQFMPLRSVSEEKLELALKVRDEAIMTLHKRLEAVEGVKKEGKK